ncbi:hypothetical protein QU481_13530 [Crenobacter sp. SG2303]|uniref:Lipoprotein n=1 Tax=Crenobacter oryzisoli TaxID=3056844 RepID=A0ABT7XQC5_9NEIS|nr:hypothetical protein [Crenobacter sp. SG2303]MDN0075908.1 hypothetical protein [Crenobacter sp. SG2303]
MARTLLAAAALAATLGLSGCAGMRDPSLAQQEAADYGHKPTQREAAALIRGHLASTLHGTAYQLKGLSSITPAWSRHDLTVITYGYLAYYNVNIKNSSGAYAGIQHRAVFIRDGHIMKELTVRDGGRLEEG